MSLLPLGLFPLSLSPLGPLPPILLPPSLFPLSSLLLGLFAPGPAPAEPVRAGPAPAELFALGLFALSLLTLGLFTLGLFTLGMLPLSLLTLSVLLSSVFSNLFPAGLLALRCAASPSIESLFIYVTGALALQAAYPPLAWSLHIGGLGLDLPAPVADVACAAVHEADIMPQPPMLHEMRLAERAQPQLERSIGAVSHSTLSATRIGAVHLLGVVSVHPPKALSGNADHSENRWSGGFHSPCVPRFLASGVPIRVGGGGRRSR